MQKIILFFTNKRGGRECVPWRKHWLPRLLDKRISFWKKVSVDLPWCPELPLCHWSSCRWCTNASVFRGWLGLVWWHQQNSSSRLKSRVHLIYLTFAFRSAFIVRNGSWGSEPPVIQLLTTRTRAQLRRYRCAGLQGLVCTRWVRTESITGGAVVCTASAPAGKGDPCASAPVGTAQEGARHRRGERVSAEVNVANQEHRELRGDGASPCSSAPIS